MADATPIDLVRTLINDQHADPADNVFTDVDLAGFLQIEGDNVKLAAAQAIDVIADNEVLTAKVIRTQGGVSFDGARVADALRRRAQTLREQAYAGDDDGASFDVVSMQPSSDYPTTFGCW